MKDLSRKWIMLMDGCMSHNNDQWLEPSRWPCILKACNIGHTESWKPEVEFEPKTF